MVDKLMIMPGGESLVAGQSALAENDFPGQ